MHILILGAAGMIGRKLAARLAETGRMGRKEISRLTLHDVVMPHVPAHSPFPVTASAADFAEPGVTRELTSYGTQKAISELLLADWSRRGILDGVGIRLPTICVRPGKPNNAASGFFSNIIREPLNGEEAVLPVSEDVRHWHGSPRSAISFLMRAAEMDTAALGARRNLSMPGLSVTVDEQIAALGRIAGKGVVRRIRREPDETIMKIVQGWPRNFDTRRALSLGFTTAERSFDDIISIHIEDELNGDFVR